MDNHMETEEKAPPEYPVNNTIYIKNLNDKARKSDLKHALYVLFSAYGPILDLVAMKTQKMKGQAFIVFADISAAEKALNALQGRIVFGKAMVLQYAKSKSKIVAKADGTWVEPTEEEKAEMEEKRRKKREADAAAAPAPVQHVPRPTHTGRVPPNKVLFIQNLPENVVEDQLVAVFSTQAGFREVRIVPGNRGLAFVEFADDRQSTAAMTKLQNIKVDGKAMHITFQKRVD